jgi:hypothetical protein
VIDGAAADDADGDDGEVDGGEVKVKTETPSSYDLGASMLDGEQAAKAKMATSGAKMNSAQVLVKTELPSSSSLSPYDLAMGTLHV